MFFEDSISKAKAACFAYISQPHPPTNDAAVTALAPILDAMKLVLAAASFAATSKTPVALQLASREGQMGPDQFARERYYFTQSGFFVVHSSVECKEGCHVFSEKKAKMNAAELIKSGLDSDVIVKALSHFLDDPGRTMLNLTSDTRRRS